MAIASAPPSAAGLVSFAAGAIALLIVLAHFWAGPLAPQQRASVTVGQFAAEMRQAAKRQLHDQPQPAPVAAPWNIDRAAKLAASVFAGLAVIAGAAGLARKEPWRPAAAGAVLGASAIVIQMFIWVILIVVGGFIVVAIIQSVNIFDP